jgi:hypothetical protein
VSDSSRKRRLAAYATAIVTMMSFGTPAGAHTMSYPTELERTGVTAPPLTIRGFISSGKNACFPKRTVTVSYGGAVVGADMTNAAGQWEVVSETSKPGEYTITVKRKFIRRTAEHRHICGADTEIYTH